MATLPLHLGTLLGAMPTHWLVEAEFPERAPVLPGFPLGRSFRIYKWENQYLAASEEGYNGASAPPSFLMSVFRRAGRNDVAYLLRLVAVAALLTSWAAAADPPLKPPALPVDADLKKLQDKIKELEKKLDPAEAPNRVSRLYLSGQVDQDTVRLKAKFVLVTSRPGAQVPIACEKAWATAATLPKGCLLLPAPPGEDGYVVQVDQAGDDHQVTLDLELPVSVRGTKGSERGFDMALPRAAITLLESLDMPPAVREVRITGRGPVASKDLSSKNGNRQPMPVPHIDRLEVTWRGPAPAQPEPLLASQAQVDVRVDEAYVTTEAELTLSLLRGQTMQWQVQLPPPPQATLEVDEPASDRVTVLPPNDAKNPLWTIQLKEASAEPVKVRIRHLQARGKAAVPIGPFAVPGAVRQQGTILVSAGPSVRLRSPAKTRGAISPREPTDEQRRQANLVAVYGYWSLPVPADSKQLVPAPLELEVETVRGAIETSVSHGIRLALGGWHVTSEIKVKPVRTEVEHLEFELPPNYELKASPPILVEPELDVKEQGGKRIGILKLARPQNQEFKVTLEGICETGEPKMMSLFLPRPMNTLDAGGRVAVSVPEGLELTVARDAGQQALPADRREASWRTDRSPAKIELAWRQHRPELPVEILLDLTVTERQIRARQHIHFRFENDPLKQIVLQAPEAPREMAPIGVNATLIRQQGQANAWLAALHGGDLTIDYAVPVPASERGRRSRQIAVPILWPEGATEVRAKVRTWSDPNLQPILGTGSGTGWQEMPLERVAERDALPVLVLAGNSAEKLNLTLTEPLSPPMPQIAVDRTLIQASIGDGGQQIYRARFRIQKFTSRQIDIELPGAPANLKLEVYLDGKQMNGLKVVDEEGRDVELGHIVRIAVEPELYRQDVILELRYQLPRDGGSWQTQFLPPRLRGHVFAGRVRWQLDTPPDWVVVATGRDTWPEQSWGLRGFLIGPKPAVAANDVERWFSGNVEQPLPQGSVGQWDVVAWQTDLQPFALYHVSQQGWLLACSLTLLAVGLALSFAPLPRRVFWSVLALTGLTLVTASILWPNTLAVVAYGAEPGALVLLLVVFLQWFFQRRYRRQVVFMPGFTRMSTGSSLVKHGSSHRPRSEPSTVDAPVGSIPEIGSRYGVPKS